MDWCDGSGHCLVRHIGAVGQKRAHLPVDRATSQKPKHRAESRITDAAPQAQTNGSLSNSVTRACIPRVCAHYLTFYHF